MNNKTKILLPIFQVWFRNRRAKEKKRRKPEDSSVLLTAPLEESSPYSSSSTSRFSPCSYSALPTNSVQASFLSLRAEHSEVLTIQRNHSDFLDQTSFRNLPSCAYASSNFSNCSTTFPTFALDSSKMFTPPTPNAVSFAQEDFQFPPFDQAHCPLLTSNLAAFNTLDLIQPLSNSNGTTSAQLSQGDW